MSSANRSGHEHVTAPGQTVAGQIAAKGLFDMEECIMQKRGRIGKHSDGGWLDLDAFSTTWSTGGATASSGEADDIAENIVADSGGVVRDVR